MFDFDFDFGQRPRTGWYTNHSGYSLSVFCANQANKEMSKDAHYEKSSKKSSEDLTKDLADPTRGKN